MHCPIDAVSELARTGDPSSIDVTVAACGGCIGLSAAGLQQTRTGPPSPPHRCIGRCIYRCIYPSMRPSPGVLQMRELMTPGPRSVRRQWGHARGTTTRDSQDAATRRSPSDRRITGYRLLIASHWACPRPPADRRRPAADLNQDLGWLEPMYWSLYASVSVDRRLVMDVAEYEPGSGHRDTVRLSLAGPIWRSVG